MEGRQDAHQASDDAGAVPIEDNAAMAFTLPVQPEEILVPRYNNPLLRDGEGHLFLIISTGQPDISRSADVGAPSSKLIDDRVGNVLVYVKSNVHESSPNFS